MLSAARKLTPSGYYADVVKTALYVVPSQAATTTLTPAAAALTFTGSTPTVTTTNHVTLTPAAATLTFTGSTPSISAGGSLSVSPAAATLSFTGSTPTVTVSNNITLTPEPAALRLSPSFPLLYLNGVPQYGSSAGRLIKGAIYTNIVQPIIRRVVQ